MQRRSQQSVSDLAALAGANASLVDTNVLTRDASATAAARAVAKTSGYEHGVNGQIVECQYRAVRCRYLCEGRRRRPTLEHVCRRTPRLPTWDVSTTATAAAGIAGSARGVTA